MKKNFLERGLNALGLSLLKSPATGRRNSSAYTSGQVTRLTEDWIPAVQTADSAIRCDLRLMRARARDHERVNSYARKFYSILENNVLGSEGVSLEMKATDPDGTPDVVANKVIKEGWYRWGRDEFCSISQEDSWVDIQNLALRGCARDGEMLLRKVRDKENPFAFSLQLLEADYLDENYSVITPSGNYVFMGVEKNPMTSRVVGYWLLKKHPGEQYFGGGGYNRYFVPKEEIIHYFVKERPTQSRGVPWLCAPMDRMNMLDRYEEAEVTAAREASVKGGFFRSDKGEQFTGPQDADGNTLQDLSPGQKDELPAGMTFIPYDPTHPTSQYGDFVRAALRSIAAGGSVSYATLTGDLTQANFSSMRAGSLEEREQWKKLQKHFIDHLVMKIFEPWLESALLAGALNIRLPFSNFDKFNAPHFRGRRWPWIDPQVDITSALIAIDGGLATRTSYLEEHADSGDLDETFDKLEDEQNKAKAKGLVFTSPMKGGGPMPPAEEAPPEPAIKPEPKKKTKKPKPA